MRFVQSVNGANGHYYYFRRSGFPRTRLPGAIGSPEFMEAYTALAGIRPIYEIDEIPAVVKKTSRKKPSYVYLFKRPDGAIKVGVASNVPRRFAQLNGASPDILSVLKITRSKEARSIEGACKKILRPLRIKGEWFRCPDDLAIMALQIAKRTEVLKALIRLRL